MKAFALLFILLPFASLSQLVDFKIYSEDSSLILTASLDTMKIDVIRHRFSEKFKIVFENQVLEFDADHLKKRKNSNDCGSPMKDHFIDSCTFFQYPMFTHIFKLDSFLYACVGYTNNQPTNVKQLWIVDTRDHLKISKQIVFHALSVNSSGRSKAGNHIHFNYDQSKRSISLEAWHNGISSLGLQLIENNKLTQVGVEKRAMTHFFYQTWIIDGNKSFNSGDNVIYEISLN